MGCTLVGESRDTERTTITRSPPGVSVAKLEIRFIFLATSCFLQVSVHVSLQTRGVDHGDQARAAGGALQRVSTLLNLGYNALEESRDTWRWIQYSQVDRNTWLYVKLNMLLITWAFLILNEG